jgi:PAS domain S-box-containing protein
MPAAPLPADEAARLKRLHELLVLDTPAEPLFDTLTQLAARSCEVPIALISLVDTERQWFKSCIGLPGTTETSRDAAFCAHAVLNHAVMVVPDAALDPRFADNPLVTGEPHIRFYAGAPLEMPSGERLGTLCVIDRQARALSDSQLHDLQDLATAVVQALLMRERSLQTAWSATNRYAEDFRVLAEASPLGVFRTDAEGACLYTNHAWQGIYGLSLADSLGHGWAQTLHPEDRAAVFERWRSDAQAGRGFDMQFRVQRSDGSVRSVHSRARQVANEQGAVDGFVGVVEDISLRLQREQRLATERELLDRTGRLAAVGGWEVDLLANQVRWSDETCRIHDRPAGHQPSLEEGIGYYAPEARSIIEAAVQRCAADGTPFDVELPMVTARGRAIWVRAMGEAQRQGGRSVRLFGAFQDITERKRAAQEMEESRQRLRQLYEDTPALLTSVSAQGLILSVSNQTLTRLGYTREQLVGQPAFNYFGGPEREDALTRVQALLQTTGRVHELPLPVRHADGSTVPMLLSAVQERDAGGRHQRTLAVFQDISEDLARQAELQRERELRQRVQHLADERREMLDVLAHEVRQPLNNAWAALQSAAALVAATSAGTGSTPDSQPTGERLSRAQGVIGHVVSQLDNTLAAATLLAGAGPIERQDTDIDTLVQLVIADLPAEQRPRVQVQRDTPTRTATMDMALMRLALRNLLVNALRHAPPSTPVLLRLIDSDQPLALVFEVEDMGCGVAPELRSRLFDRGARGGSSKGQGLGLYIARRALQLHGGSAELVASGPGRTVFRLVLVQSEAEDSRL